jgi:PPOX class probable F420-dependent enzyme
MPSSPRSFRNRRTKQFSCVLSEKQLDFAARPLLCKFASTNIDGSPHVTPTWFMYEDGKFVITTPQNTVKARNARRDNRVALLMDDGESYLMVRGNARIRTGSSPKRITEKLAMRYEGEEGKKKAAELLKEPHITIEVTPFKIISQGL